MIGEAKVKVPGLLPGEKLIPPLGSVTAPEIVPPPEMTVPALVMLTAPRVVKLSVLFFSAFTSNVPPRLTSKLTGLGAMVKLTFFKIVVCFASNGMLVSSEAINFISPGLL
ncbi:MAG: hypothetical protein ACK56I_31580, partial [bacterium]